MAIVIRRYVSFGPSVAVLQALAHVTGVTRAGNYPGSAIDVSVDDTVLGVETMADEAMAQCGWAFDSTFVPGGTNALIFVWGNSDIGTLIDTRYLSPGRDVTAQLGDVAQFPVTRSGTLRNLFIRHNSVGIGVANVTYAVLVNSVPTAITATLATGAIGQVSDLTHSVMLVQGDRVSVQAAKDGIITSGVIDAQVSLEFV